MAEQSFVRSGAAARKPATAKPRTPRRTRTPADDVIASASVQQSAPAPVRLKKPNIADEVVRATDWNLAH